MKIPSRFASVRLFFLAIISLTSPLSAQAISDMALQLHGDTANHTQSLPQEPLSIDMNASAQAFIGAYQEELAAKGFRSEIELGNIDPRLKPKTCMGEPKLKFTRNPAEQANTTILLECQAPTPWKFYLNASIHIFGPAVVTAQPIARGTRLEASDLMLEEVQINVSRHTNYPTIEPVTGMIARRNIKAGAIISPRMLKPPRLVSRGDEVMIVAANDKISIRMKGTALSHGVRGQQIAVRNNRSERVIQAVVTETGLVQVRL